jgi:hypothetical protein
MAETAIHEVDWFDHDYVYLDGARGTYRHCDICMASFIDDPPFQPRKFYRDDAEQLIVCEKCLPNYPRETERALAQEKSE